MIRVSDYVISFLGNAGVKHVFMVSGGGGMYLIDSLGRSEVIQYVCNHHEQASAMSAEGYQRITGNIGVALVTTGPAGTNAITGVMCAWNDSIPMLVLSGQVNSKSLIGDTGLRQRGVHEANITEIVKTITKYAVTVTDVNMIRYHLERGLFLAKNGRPGPVWIDIPLDIQSAMINPLELEGFNNVEACNEIVLQPSVYELETVKELLYNAKRPIILAGHGIKLANAKNEFVRFIEKYSIPVVTTKNAFDLIEDDHFLLAGRIGTYGQRAGNFAVQNSDLVISLGSRLANPTVGYNVEMFAREAKKVVVDIDSNQLKHSTIKVDVTINADVKVFIQKIDSILIEKNSNDFSPWIEKCKEWRKTYPVILPEWKEQKKYVNSYYFFEALSEKMTADDILVTDQGASFYSFTVAFK
ncbi:MAG: thiamine pyrophosphate-binding protein, partial [Sphingobacterium sp.]